MGRLPQDSRRECIEWCLGANCWPFCVLAPSSRLPASKPCHALARSATQGRCLVLHDVQSTAW